MVGEGIVTLGVCLVTDFRNLKSSSWIGRPCFTLPVTLSTGGAKPTSPFLVWNCAVKPAWVSTPSSCSRKSMWKYVAAEFAVGDSFQAQVLLELHDVADGGVLDLAKVLLRDLALGQALAGIDDFPGAQEAADVVGAERRLGACAHASAPGSFTFSILSNSMFQSLPSFISHLRM